MKITLLANKDLAANYALNLLLPRLKQHQVNLFYSKSVGGNTPPLDELQALQNYEQQLLGDGYSNNLAGENNHLMCSFFDLSRQCSFPTQELNRINQADELAIYQQTAPDLVVSIRFGVILKEPVIKVPPLGIINLHSGLLPQYQGVMATFWAMLNGDKSIGTSLHYIVDEQIDTGPIISTTKQTVNYDRSYLWNVLNLYQRGVDSIVEAVSNIELNKMVQTLNTEETGRYYTFPKKKDISEFLKQGHLFFDETEFA